MTTPDGPNYAAELGASLKKARGELTGTDLSEHAGWGKSGKTKVSKIEGGTQTPSEADLDAWAAITGVSDRVRDQWKLLAVQAATQKAGNYKKRASNGQEIVQREYSDLAAQTNIFRFFEMTFIPRYLQIPEYTRFVLTEHHEKHGAVNDIDAATHARQGSVQYLYDASKTFTFLIDEPVLRKTRVPAAIMRPQLDRLLSAVGLPNVTLAIYPSLSSPVGSFTESSFEIFDDIAYIETAAEDGSRLLADDVERLEGLFRRYWQDAATGDDARQLILNAAAIFTGEGTSAQGHH